MLRIIHFNFVNGIQMEAQYIEHSEHCFDFLRQAISCYSDTTLEMPQLNNGKDISRATSNSKRQCRDFEEIKDWTERSYKSWETRN
jgi:hypothetical protein